MRTPSRRRAIVPIIFVAALLGYTVWPWLPFSRAEATPPTIVFYGFSILADVMQEAVFPAFQRAWAAGGQGPVEFVSSFGGSGTVTNQLLMGVPAQVALLSLESDADRLADAGVIERDGWKRLPNAGVVNLTPFVIIVRRGNPRSIHSFEDLGRRGIRVVHPDPMTSGGANWAIVAEYGSGARGIPGGEAAGEAVLAGVWKNVVAQAASARAARTQFENGFGDALVTYEQEAIADRGKDRLDAEVVYPPRTILSEHTLVVLDRHVRPPDRALVAAFVHFLWSDEAQRLFVRYGFRSVRPDLDSGNPAFGTIADPFRIADFGGWRAAKRDIVERVWRDRVMKETAAR
jgi:sulfate/thiosulfate transport system substrate-binding protein